MRLSPLTLLLVPVALQAQDPRVGLKPGLFDAGGGQESEIFRFASDVDTDQRAEIRRMQALLASLPPA